MPTINEEVYGLWKRAAQESGMQLPQVGGMSAVLDEIAGEVASIGRPKLEPWVSILEEGIQWLAHLYSSLARAMQQQPSDRLRVPWSLTGFACSQACAIHRLSLSGLDIAAKGSLRSLIEALHVLVVCLADEELSNRFLMAQDFEKARHLWYLELSPKKLSMRLSSIISSLGLDEEFNAEVRDWMNAEFEVASQFVHVSYVSAVLACVPRNLDDQITPLAILGSPTALSKRTLATAAWTIWFFSRIAFHLLVRPQVADTEPIHRLNHDDESDRIIWLGYRVYKEVLWNHWTAKTNLPVQDREAPSG